MADATNPAEKRVHERLPLHLAGSAEVLYRRRLDRAYQDPALGKSGVFRIETVNVSQGGMMITFDTDISTGDVIRGFLAHPETGAEITVEGQIQWMSRNATGILGRYCAGVSFRNTPDAVVDPLLEYARKPAPGS